MLITITIDTVKDEPEEVQGVLKGMAKLFGLAPAVVVEPVVLRKVEDVFCLLDSWTRTRGVGVIYNTKVCFGVDTVQDLSFITNKELLEVKNCGMSTVSAIRRALADYYGDGQR